MASVGNCDRCAIFRVTDVGILKASLYCAGTIPKGHYRPDSGYVERSFLPVTVVCKRPPMAGSRPSRQGDFVHPVLNYCSEYSNGYRA